MFNFPNNFLNRQQIVLFSILLEGGILINMKQSKLLNIDPNILFNGNMNTLFTNSAEKFQQHSHTFPPVCQICKNLI